MERSRSLMAQWGLLAAALLAGAALALHEHQGRVGLPPPPIPSYTVDQVLDGVSKHPSLWIGTAVWVKGLWWDTCGWWIPPSKLASNELAHGGCAMPSPGIPEEGLTDSLPNGYTSRTLAVRVDGSWTSTYGGPLQLEEGIPAYYRVTLGMEKPCALVDGGPWTNNIPKTPPNAPGCPLGDVIQSQL